MKQILTLLIICAAIFSCREDYNKRQLPPTMHIVSQVVHGDTVYYIQWQRWYSPVYLNIYGNGFDVLDSAMWVDTWNSHNNIPATARLKKAFFDLIDGKTKLKNNK